MSRLFPVASLPPDSVLSASLVPVDVTAALAISAAMDCGKERSGFEQVARCGFTEQDSLVVTHVRTGRLRH